MDINHSIDRLFEQRSRPLFERFPGHYRALVVETNDPLNMRRVKFNCPDLHDSNLNPIDCPWAIPSTDIGGQHASRFVNPCIGDWVWITFERQHPYGPIWTGFATPTRRTAYSYAQISQPTPLPLNNNGQLSVRQNDYQQSYLPKDGRPMSHGWQDRYGHIDLHSAVGFYPVEHKASPPPPDFDAISNSHFQQQRSAPIANDPDIKMMARVTKYGMIIIQSDQGYQWQLNGDAGEFSGDSQLDQSFEIKRWKYLQRLMNEGRASGLDARRELFITRYGTRFEMRDTGWAQLGPIKSQSRSSEYGSKRVLSLESRNDFRWFKIRSKGGMLIQGYDKGCNPATDSFINRDLLSEQGPRSEREDLWWANKDARMLRLVTRHGIKIVLDDRGTDQSNAHQREYPRANGVLIKGRRSPGAKNRPTMGNQRGFYWEFNENDEANHTLWGSPLGQTIEINDRYQYLLLASSLGQRWATRWQGIKENEFNRKPAMIKDPESTSFHLKLDHDNEYLRLKTRAGKGPRAMAPVVRTGVMEDELNQGLEARDGDSGDGPWVELVDCQHRGIWFSKNNKLGVWRAGSGVDMAQWFDDNAKKIVIFNNEETGTIEIYATGVVNVTGSDINIKAKRSLNFKAGDSIKMQAGSAILTISEDIKTNRNLFARSFTQRPDNATPITPAVVPSVPQLEPTDRGQTYNAPFEECPKVEVEHPQ